MQQQKMLLTVNFYTAEKPKVAMRLGRNLDPDNLRTGNDIFKLRKMQKKTASQCTFPLQRNGQRSLLFAKNAKKRLLLTVIL